MKFAVVLLLIFSPSLSYSDAGISVSYRSTPVIIEKNWLNDSKWPDEYAYYEGITTQRTLNMVTVNLYFDDSLKAHDKKKDKGSRWPRALRVSKGAGYIFGINFNYAAEDELVEYYSWDAYIGKRLFLIPHMAHLYFKIGPSWARYNYDFIERELFTETRIGGFYNLGLQVLVVKGIKIFAETEFRGYGPAPMSDSFNLEGSQMDFVNTLPPFSENYKDTKFTKGWARDLITQGVRFGLKFNF
jgi:hypothetical protein